MRTAQLALHMLTGLGDEVRCINGCPFDRIGYSNFKHGYEPAGVEYGYELADLIGEDVVGMAHETGSPVVILSAPYKYAQTASAQIALHLGDALAPRFVSADLEPPMIIPFQKSRPGSASYAKSGLAARQRSLSTMKLAIDANRVAGAIVLVVDDINITGSTMRNTASRLEPLGPSAIWYLHAATVDPGLASTHPQLESELNESAPHGLTEVLEWAMHDEFALNTRILRCMLETDSKAEFYDFLLKLPYRLLLQVYRSIIGSGPQYVARYSESFGAVKAALSLYGAPISQVIVSSTPTLSA